jgi:hypothetical protein
MMKNRIFGKRLAVVLLAASICAIPIAGLAQTQITAPKNKYKVQDDIKLGNQASVEIEREFPILNDYDATNYVRSIGDRLVAAIPPQFQHPEFQYRFKLVDARDINAFALPGGPMYVNRGMIEAARNEGEIAGVMAHELSHVALRHATAQATKQSSASHQLGMIGMILGGAVLGGQAGAELGAMGASAWMTKFSREYETQADTLGAQIMANAGYDPRDLANVFKTIEQQSGGGPQWLSDHPNPGIRYENINREAQQLHVSPNPIKLTRDFERVQARMRAMPRARTMAEIEHDYKNGRQTYPVSSNGNYDPNSNGSYNPNPNGNYDPASSGRYSNSVQYPSSRFRTYTGVNGLGMNVPSNWQDFNGQDGIEFAPEGARGDRGITHGALMGVYRGQNNDLARDSEEYITQVIQGNSYLSQRGSFAQTSIAGRVGYTTQLSGRSPITGRTEIVTVYVFQLRSGDIMYIDTVVPGDESQTYASAFRNMISSVRIND